MDEDQIPEGTIIGPPVDQSSQFGPGPGQSERDPYGYHIPQGHDGNEGVAFGAGYTHTKTRDGLNLQEFYVQGGTGDWVDPVTGKTNHGSAIEGGMVKMGDDLGNGPGGLGWDFGAATFNAGAYSNDSIHSIGAGANMIEGSVTAGSEENNVRFGLSAGGGMGGRVHHGDADGDGRMEAGFGVDYGFGSFDVKSELIGDIWNSFNDPNAGVLPEEVSCG